MKTPTTPAGLRGLDHLDPADAVVRAWTDPGPRPGWHREAQRVVRETMPLVARHLDRLAAAAAATPAPPATDDDTP